MSAAPVSVGRPYRVLVLGGGYDYIRFMFELQFQGAKTPEEADIILFTGGEDVDPRWYGEKPLKETFSNPERDRMEKVIFDMAVEKGIPMVGICRGGQFLNVMNDGGMWQHVNNHVGLHIVQEVLPAKAPRGMKPRRYEVTSTHHQMMRPSAKGRILAVGVDEEGNSLCSQRACAKQEVASTDAAKYPDVEVVWYEDTKCLCFQPHPEFPQAPQECKDYFEELLEDYILPVA